MEIRGKTALYSSASHRTIMQLKSHTHFWVYLMTSSKVGHGKERGENKKEIKKSVSSGEVEEERKLDIILIKIFF